MKLLMTLTGLIVGQLGIITAIHSDHYVLGVLLLFFGVWSVSEGVARWQIKLIAQFGFGIMNCKEKKNKITNFIE